MDLQNLVNRYKQAINQDKSECCVLAGSTPSCKQCINYKLRINRIVMNLTEQELKSQEKLTNNWEYYPLWQEIIKISDELNTLGLSLMKLDVNENNVNENNVKKITSVLKRSKEAIAKLELKNN